MVSLSSAAFTSGSGGRSFDVNDMDEGPIEEASKKMLTL